MWTWLREMRGQMEEVLIKKPPLFTLLLGAVFALSHNYSP
jgi:hypothetical protein